MATYRVRARQNHDSGMETILHFDEGSGKLYIEERQSADAIMATLARVNAARDLPKSRRDTMRQKAELPHIVGLQWANEAGVRWGSQEYEEVVKRKLDDLDFRRLRIDK